MKKILAIGLAAALSLTMLAGCGETGNTDNNGGNGGNGNNNETTNTAPVIAGVKEEVTIMAGTEFNALEGVTATDAEDGDLTSKIEVTSDELTFTNGKVTPTVPNELMGYFVEYSVKDSGGKEATASTTLFVTEKVAELENVYTADFSAAPAAKDEDRHGWNMWASEENGVEATAEVKDGAYVIDVKNMPTTVNGDGDLNLNKTVNDLGVGQYKFIVWAKASVETYYCMFAKDAKKDGWVTYGDGHYHQKLGTETKAYVLDFELTEEALAEVEGNKTNIEFHFNLGRKDPESADMPESFTIYVNKIAIYKTTGVDKEEEVFKNDFSQAGENQIFPRNDNGADSTATIEDGAAKFNITKYPNQPNVWELKADVALGDVAIEEGGRYRIAFEITAASNQPAEVLIENGENNDRAGYLNGSLELKAGVKQELSYNFTAEKAIAANKAMLRFQIGKPSDGVSSNVLTIDNVVLYKITGDKKTEKNVDKFVLFGKGSTNETDSKLPFDVFNGSDDDPANKGIGTAYIKDGKLVYEIEEGSASGGQNKLVIGYWENPINLPKDAYYVVSFKVKASASIGMDVCLHDMDCGDNWDNGLLYRRASWMPEGNYAIGTAETTVEFTTEVVYKESKCELILEFGSEALSKLSGVTIEISEIEIGVKKLAD